jgi:hypothetical protein
VEAKNPPAPAEKSQTPTPHDHEREDYSPLYSAAVRDTCSNTCEGGGFAATNVSFRWSMILSIA